MPSGSGKIWDRANAGRSQKPIALLFAYSLFWPHPLLQAGVTFQTGVTSRGLAERQTVRNRSSPMKSLLALAILALTALLFEEKARQVAGDAHDALDQAVVQAREAKLSLTQKVEQQPLISVLVAGGIAYALAKIVPARTQMG
jgi:hypothetical protein